MSDDLRQRLKDFLKRKRSLESPQILAKVPKLEDDQVTEEKLDENIENNVNDVLMEKVDKIMTKIDRYRSPNQESTFDLNSKLDKILNVLDEKPERPKKRTFMQFYGNVMEWSWEGHFDTENFMKNYGITGINVTSHILSYLDFKSMVAARKVSKTWYAFIENQRGILISLMRKCFEDIPKKAHQIVVESSPGIYVKKVSTVGNDEWQIFGEEIIERDGKVADIVTLISTLELRYSNPNGHSFTDSNRNFANQYPNYKSPIRAIINLGRQKKEDKNFWQNLNFMKLLVKYGKMEKEDVWNEGYLLSWSLWEIEALKFVVTFLSDKFQLTNYAESMLGQLQSPMWEVMRQKEKGLEKVQMLIPLATKKFWNSVRKRDSDDHTPLADAIMIGNVEIVKAFMPLTKLTANPKGRRFGSYLHVAIRYGHLEILKILMEHFKDKNFDWQQLKEKEGRSIYDLLKDENFEVQIYDENADGGAVKAKEDVGKKSKKDMLEFIESIM